MFKGLKNLFLQCKKKKPEDDVRGDYYELLQRLKKLERQVEDRAKQLELAKTSFLKNLYHEIRTPLNAIIGFTNLLSKETNLNPEEQEEYLTVINKSSNDFLRIMDDIIQASLLEAGMVHMNNEKFMLKTLMDETYSYFSIRKHLLEKNNIALLMNIPTQFQDLEVLCDKYYLMQILNQLLENALKFTEKGTIEFGYSLDEKNVEFFVKDTGNGNLKGKENFLFSRFTKVDVSDNAKTGLGIGLSNCKNLVELMKGKIWYNSIPGKGTCFRFSLPVVATEGLVAEHAIKMKETSLLEDILRGQGSLAV